jgi:hypothetical protein
MSRSNGPKDRLGIFLDKTNTNNYKYFENTRGCVYICENVHMRRLEETR